MNHADVTESVQPLPRNSCRGITTNCVGGCAFRNGVLAAMGSNEDNLSNIATAGAFCPGGAGLPSEVMIAFIDQLAGDAGADNRLTGRNRSPGLARGGGTAKPWGRADLRRAADRPIDVLLHNAQQADPLQRSARPAR